MNTAARTPPEAWRLQVLRHLQANPSLSQRQLAGQMGVSLGKANYCLRALVEKGLVKLGNFRKNQNKRQYAYLLTPAGLEEKTRITQAFLKSKEAEFESIRREIEALKSELESSGATRSLIALDIPAALEIPSGIALHSATDWMLVKDE